ncbi:hypothetical protein FB451DRAFT_1005018, partial [Mycena latifolia]
IPSIVSTHPSSAHFISGASGLDAPKIHPVNSSTFEWWYFDAVPHDPRSRASVVVVFYTATASAFPFLAPAGTATLAQIAVTFPNGTAYGATVPADGATVTADENVSSGDWHNSGFRWTHSGDHSGYTVLIDAPHIGVKGSIRFRSPAPAHYPCGPTVAGQTMEAGPGNGWANAVPDADATVDLTIGRTKLTFAGLGYHDKNWGNEPFATHLASWYWGHGRLGAYSIVWFDVLARDGKEHVSAYAAKHGRIVAASCAPGSIRVRPAGANATYPPLRGTGNPSGYRIALELPGAGTLKMNVSVTGILVDDAFSEYTRAVATLKGVVVPAGGLK